MADMLKATPRNEFLYGAGSVLGKVKEALNSKRQLSPLERELAGKYADPENQWSVGNLLLGQVPETLKDWSYQGSSPVHGTRNIQTTSVDPRVVDVAAVAAPLANPALRLAKAAAPTIARQAVNLAEKYGVSPVMNVVKPEGPSNWLPGSVELTTDRLKEKPKYFEEITGDKIIERGLLPIWNEMHTTRHNAVLPSEQAAFIEYYYPEKLRDFGLMYTPQDQAINTFIDKRLKKYIRNEMGTESDPVRALAERGVLHYAPDDLETSGVKNIVALRRTKAGFPAGGSGESDLARRWEISSDYTIEGNPVSRWKEEADPKVLAKMPWIEHLGPADTIWERTDSGMRSRLGLDHLVDELKNAVDPDSTLPQHLRLSNKQLEQMPMERAVEHVSKINDWRAAEAARAEQEGLKANLSASARLEDTSFNPSFAEGQGGKWVDIPNTADENGMQLCTSIGKAGGWCTQGQSMAKSYGSGDNRLATLIDNDGRPHAQVTITSEDKFPSWEVSKKFIPQARQKMADQLAQAGKSEEEIADILSRDEATIKNWATYMARDAMPKSITELKPVGNSISSSQAREYARRDPEYQSKVQQSVVNFLNSQKWDRVKNTDLQHLGIVDLNVAGQADSLPGIDSEALYLAFHNAPEDTPRFMTDKQFKDFVAPYLDTGAAFAAGGLVDYNEDDVDKMSDQLLQGEYGLRVTGEPKGKGALGEIRMPAFYKEGGKADKEEYSMPEKINRYVRQSQFKAADLVGLGPEVDFATTIPERYYPADEQHMGRGDAMRHLLLQAQLYKKYGELPAKTIGFLHEMLGGGQTDAEEAMDKYNDILGREIGKASKDRYDMVKRAMEAIENKKARVMTEAEKRESGYAEGGLVYNDDLINQLAEDLFGVK